jgi:hypothetical protein
MSKSIFSQKLAQVVLLTLLFGAALTIRMYDLTDLPLDFHPTRQLLSAIKARALYFETQPDGYSTWQLETAIKQAQLKTNAEPVIFEQIVAYTYRYTGEQVWIARIYGTLFWLIGGIFLFMLVRDLVSFEGALISTAYYLLFPYAVIASRSFQPDPLMVALIISFLWMLSSWTRFPTWTKALLGGLLGGLAIYVKFSAAFFVIGGALGLVLSRYTLRELFHNAQVWVMAVVGALPALAYLIYGVYIAGFLGEKFSGRFVPALLLSPLNYLQWETKVSFAAGGVFIMLGLLGFFFAKDRHVRSFMFGLWGSYLLYGLFFDYHVATHDYYHLPLIPIVAVSLSPLGDAFLARLSESAPGRWMPSAVFVILLYGVLSVTWDIRNQMKAVDYRPEAAMWAEIGELLDYESTAIALTQDYGSRLEYFGWTGSTNWPASGDIYATYLRGGKFEFEDAFPRIVRNKTFFLVTDFDELNKQPELKAKLSTYPVYAEDEGYIMYQLREE